MHFTSTPRVILLLEDRRLRQVDLHDPRYSFTSQALSRLFIKPRSNSDIPIFSDSFPTRVAHFHCSRPGSFSHRSWECREMARKWNNLRGRNSPSFSIYESPGLIQGCPHQEEHTIEVWALASTHLSLIKFQMGSTYLVRNSLIPKRDCHAIPTHYGHGI
jgi:hypothetical protein